MPEELRTQVVLEVEFCSCGGYCIAADACKEVDMKDKVLFLGLPISYILLDTDPEGCTASKIGRVVGTTTFPEIPEDVRKTLETAELRMAEEEQAELEAGISEMIELVLANEVGEPPSADIEEAEDDVPSELRQKVALHLDCCSCGGFNLVATPCESMDFEGLVRIKWPMSFQLLNTDPSDCQAPESDRFVGPSTFAELYDDIIKVLEHVECELDDIQQDELHTAIQEMTVAVCSSRIPTVGAG